PYLPRCRPGGPVTVHGFLGLREDMSRSDAPRAASFSTRQGLTWNARETGGAAALSGTSRGASSILGGGRRDGRQRRLVHTAFCCLIGRPVERLEPLQLAIDCRLQRIGLHHMVEITEAHGVFRREHRCRHYPRDTRWRQTMTRELEREPGHGQLDRNLV